MKCASIGGGDRMSKDVTLPTITRYLRGENIDPSYYPSTIFKGILDGVTKYHFHEDVDEEIILSKGTLLILAEDPKNKIVDYSDYMIYDNSGRKLIELDKMFDHVLIPKEVPHALAGEDAYFIIVTGGKYQRGYEETVFTEEFVTQKFEDLIKRYLKEKEKKRFLWVHVDD